MVAAANLAHGRAGAPGAKPALSAPGIQRRLWNPTIPTKVLSKHARMVGAFLALEAYLPSNPVKGECDPSVGKIARALGCSKDTVEQGLGELEALRLVAAIARVTRTPDGRRFRTTNLYRWNPEAVQALRGGKATVELMNPPDEPDDGSDEELDADEPGPEPRENPAKISMPDRAATLAGSSGYPGRQGTQLSDSPLASAEESKKRESGVGLGPVVDAPAAPPAPSAAPSEPPPPPEPGLRIPEARPSESTEAPAPASAHAWEAGEVEPPASGPRSVEPPALPASPQSETPPSAAAPAATPAESAPSPAPSSEPVESWGLTASQTHQLAATWLPLAYRQAYEARYGTPPPPQPAAAALELVKLAASAACDHLQRTAPEHDGATLRAHVQACIERWLGRYFADAGTKGFLVATHHALQFLPRALSTYGSPWPKPTPPPSNRPPSNRPPPAEPTPAPARRGPDDRVLRAIAEGRADTSWLSRPYPGSPSAPASAPAPRAASGGLEQGKGSAATEASRPSPSPGPSAPVAPPLAKAPAAHAAPSASAPSASHPVAAAPHSGRPQPLPASASAPLAAVVLVAQPPAAPRAAAGSSALALGAMLAPACARATAAVADSAAAAATESATGVDHAAPYRELFAWLPASLSRELEALVSVPHRTLSLGDGRRRNALIAQAFRAKLMADEALRPRDPVD